MQPLPPSTAVSPITREYQAHMAQLRSLVYRDVETFWPRLDLNALDASFPAFASAIVLVILARRALALPLTTAYLAQMGVPVAVTDVAPAPTLEMMSQIRYASVVSVKQAMTAGTPLDVAGRNALVNTMGVADMEIGNGNRALIRENLVIHGRIGWTRATTGACCDWCRKMANRRVLPPTVPMAAHPHDACVPQPVALRDGQFFDI